MSQIMGLPADKLLEEYTPGEKMAYTYNSGYQAAVADTMKLIVKRWDYCFKELNWGSWDESMSPHKAIAKFAGGLYDEVKALLEDKQEGQSIDGGL